MLLVDERVVLRAGAPPEAEYALFEPGEIELHASEPGRVHEHGYRTTALEARSRLAQAGVTASLARECAEVMQPVLARAYARGSAVAQIAEHLGPRELLESDAFQANPRGYHGVFLDLAQLARDLQVPSAGVVLQALHLAAVLDDERPDAPVVLTTEPWTRQLKPGERTHKRPPLSGARRLLGALAELSREKPAPTVDERMPRADVIAFVRGRADTAVSDRDRAIFAELERSLSVRSRPDRGPLADPELWEIERHVDEGRAGAASDLLDDIERGRGRTPGTTYLRARASLALGLEPPAEIAERISALALSMTSFQELSLLAAEAWLEADDPRRAMPFARDLVDAAEVDEGLLLKAQRLLARAVGAAPGKTVPPPEPSPADPRLPTLPPVSVPDPDLAQTYEPARSRVPTVRGGTLPPGARAFSSPPPRHAVSGARFESVAPPAEPDPRAEPETPARPMASPRVTVAVTRPAGASLPPYRRESPAPLLPSAPLLPRAGAPEELAEDLSLPPGVLAERLPPGARPTSVLEARVELTLLGRELGREYRLERGVRLHTDLRGVEAMQAFLFEAFPDRTLVTAEDADVILRHGALFSEILARRLDAEWIDITPKELGYWAMIIPPDTRVWPFGRIARLVTMGSAEPDLVATFLELAARAGGR
jgi:hypothetical protein